MKRSSLVEERLQAFVKQTGAEEEQDRVAGPHEPFLWDQVVELNSDEHADRRKGSRIREIDRFGIVKSPSHQ